MKITFEGNTFHDIADEMESLLALVTKKYFARHVREAEE